MRETQKAKNRENKFCGTAIAKIGNDLRYGYTKGENNGNLKIKKYFCETGIAKKEGDRHTAFNKIQKSRDPAGIKNLAGIIKFTGFHRKIRNPINQNPDDPKSVMTRFRIDRISPEHTSITCNTSSNKLKFAIVA